MKEKRQRREESGKSQRALISRILKGWMMQA
jgi:hypothetical protein